MLFIDFFFSFCDLADKLIVQRTGLLRKKYIKNFTSGSSVKKRGKGWGWGEIKEKKKIKHFVSLGVEINLPLYFAFLSPGWSSELSSVVPTIKETCVQGWLA